MARCSSYPQLIAPLLAAFLLPALAVAEQVPVNATVATPEGGCTYSWPEGMSAKVTDKVDKKGKNGVQAFTLTLAPRDDGNFEVHYSDFHFLEFDGEKVTPEMEKQLAPVVAMASAIPITVVSPSGSFVEVDGFDAMITNVVDFLVASGEVGKEDVAMVESMMRTPGMKSTVIGTAQATWNGWIGDWVGLDLKPGAVVDNAIPVNASAPEGPKQQLRIEHLGDAPDHPGHVRFKLTITVADEAARELLMPMLTPMLSQIPASEQAKMQEAVATMTGAIVRVVEATTDPTTLRPARVLTSKITTLKVAALGMDQEQKETHEYTFEWVPAPN